ncbi:discoidin domain-containing protein [Seonamhaeicola sp.]|uniref:discoidin domain-containing protein n=1 Tax=Seonamhaeicola sp. TaxID=1912245 RepID=UPI0026172723|nr:discoidin domain-containing protein [Seonamhaeicola sp.]
MKKNNFIAAVTLFLTVISLSAQMKISVDADSYEQEFTGTGGSCGLYIGHYLSMTQANRLEASRMLYEDLKLTSIKNYDGKYPADNSAGYDKIATAITNAKIYNPNVEVVICVNNLPDVLEVSKGEYDPSIPNIFDLIADYYFKVCEAYHVRGHSVDVLELVNERGYGDGKVTELYDQAATKFKALINDGSHNTNNVPMPLIMGPATWSAASPPTFINGWKASRPNAWANVDIVSTHGYNKSKESNYQATFDISEGKPFYQSEQTGRIQVDEANGVDVIGEQFPDREYAPNFVTNASIAKHMIDFFNGGGNKFFAFLTNTQRYDHNAGLLGTPWGKTPGPTNIYYGFKHLSATHALGSKRVNRDLTNINTNYFKTVSFRKEGEDVVYVHILNMYDSNKQVELDFKTDGIKSIQIIKTDEFLDFQEVKNETLSTPLASYFINTTPYSVTTAVVTLEGTSSTFLQPQSITFNAISDMVDSSPDFNLNATASSGLPVTYQILDGPATITGSTLSLNGIGIVRIRATQAGDNIYGEALPVEQSFYVRPPLSENIALNKPVTASSQKNSFAPSNAVDGTLIGNSSRWVSADNATFTSSNPQWIEIDLEADYDVKALGLYTGYSGYKNPIYNFKFQIWDESTTDWNNAFDAIDQINNQNPIYLKDFPAVTTNKVRLTVEDAPKDFNIQLYEIQVFGELANTASVKDAGLKKFGVFPNPTNDILHLKNISQEVTATITDIRGIVIKKLRAKDYIDISSLKPALYFLSIKDYKTEKFIKN